MLLLKLLELWQVNHERMGIDNDNTNLLSRVSNPCITGAIEMNDKPNCYDCKHRGSVPGSAHIKCNHPNTKTALNDPELQLLAIFASVKRVRPIHVDVGLNIIGKPHGIKNGWFNWPFNFDPVWLESCDGFEKKGDQNDQ